MNALLPRVIYQMTVHGGLLVGSYAKYMVGEDVSPSDFDVLVPLDRWQTVAMLIPENARPNRLGWRFEVKQDGRIWPVYVWPDTLANYLTNCRTKHGGAVIAIDYINNRVYSAEQRPLRLYERKLRPLSTR